MITGTTIMAGAAYNTQYVCSICHCIIIFGDTVSMDCACKALVCRPCALAQIPNQPTTYHDGLECRSCNQRSLSIFGVDECRADESRLVASALQYLGLPRHGDKDYDEASASAAELAALKAFVAATPRRAGSITLQQLEVLEPAALQHQDYQAEDGDEAHRSTAMAPVTRHRIRLELARREASRLLQYHAMSAGPLTNLSLKKDLSMERNIRRSSTIPKSKKRQSKIDSDVPVFATPSSSSSSSSSSSCMRALQQPVSPSDMLCHTLSRTCFCGLETVGYTGLGALMRCSCRERCTGQSLYHISCVKDAVGEDGSVEGWTCTACQTAASAMPRSSTDGYAVSGGKRYTT